MHISNALTTAVLLQTCCSIKESQATVNSEQAFLINNQTKILGSVWPKILSENACKPEQRPITSHHREKKCQRDT